jgi:hypothetical protein
LSQASKVMFCPECIKILDKNIKSKLHLVKNPNGEYHYKGSMDRHRVSAHGYVLPKDRK